MPNTANFFLVGICNRQTKGHGVTIMIKSVITPDVPRAQVTIAISTHFDPTGWTNDSVTGTHVRRFAKKKLIVHMTIKPIIVQMMKEKTLPRKILLYRRSTLHFAMPGGRTWKTQTVKSVWLSVLGKFYALQITYVVRNLLHRSSRTEAPLVQKM